MAGYANVGGRGEAGPTEPVVEGELLQHIGRSREAEPARTPQSLEAR